MRNAQSWQHKIVCFNRVDSEAEDGYTAGQMNSFFLSLFQRGYSQSDRIQHRFPLTILGKKRTMKTILKPEPKISQHEKRGDLQDRDFQDHGRPATLSGMSKCSKEKQTENKQKSEDLYLPASQEYSILQPYQYNISLCLL